MIYANDAGLRQDEVPYLLHSGGVDLWAHLSMYPEQEALFSAAMAEGDRAGACGSKIFRA